MTTTDLAELRPLQLTAARRVDELALQLHGSDGLLVRETARFSTADVSEEEVAAWLAALPLGHADDPLVLTWHAETALQVPLRLFVVHWDDFCYPASDDVTVFPHDLSWVLAYFHEESFFYGILRDV